MVPTLMSLPHPVVALNISHSNFFDSVPSIPEDHPTGGNKQTRNTSMIFVNRLARTHNDSDLDGVHSLFQTL